MRTFLQDLGVNLLEITQESSISGSSSSSAAAGVIKTATDLNQRVKTATNDEPEKLVSVLFQGFG